MSFNVPLNWSLMSLSLWLCFFLTPHLLSFQAMAHPTPSETISLWLPDLPITQTVFIWKAAQISQVVLSRLQWFGNSNLLVNFQHSMWKDKYEWNIVRLAAMQRPKKIWGIKILKALHFLCYNVWTVAQNCEDLLWHVVSNFHASRSNGISMRQQSVIKNIEEGKVSWCCYVVQNQCNPFCFTKEKKGKPSV